MLPGPPIVVFCDLDDTLFAPHRFSVDAGALRLFSRIERERLPIVLCSTKTRAELELIQQRLEIRHPFICENRAAAFVPQGYFGFAVPHTREVAGYDVVEFGKTSTEIVAALHRTARRLDVDVVGFSDMSVEDVAAECDLPLLQARLAKLREYSEQFRVVDERRGAVLRLLKALNAAGLECRNRGRYYHLGARGSDDGCYVVRALYERAFDDIRTVAFCDHLSGASLLRHADVPLVVPSPESDESRRLLVGVPSSRPTVADSLGDWAETILQIAEMTERRRSVTRSVPS